MFGFESHTLRKVTPGQALVIGINHTVCHTSLPQRRGSALWHGAKKLTRSGPFGRTLANMTRDTRSAYRSRAAATERMVDEAVQSVRDARDAEWEAARALAAELNAAVPFTDDEYRSARAVRTKTGWRAVVKVNAKSVSVASGYSWTDRVPRAQVLEVRA